MDKRGYEKNVYASSQVAMSEAFKDVNKVRKSKSKGRKKLR